MITYNNIMERLSAAGYSSYRIQRDKIIPNSTLNRLRHNEPVNLTTIDVICRLCKCQPGDLLRWQPDDTPEN